MQLEEIYKVIDDKANAELKASQDFYKNLPEESPTSEPVDIYRRNQDRIYDVNQKSYPKGSSQAVNMATTAVIDGVGAEGLAKAYKRARDDSDSLKEQGERGRAEIRRQQYMQEYFLPAVEIVVNSTSPDLVLSNEKALQELDKYVLLEGSGKGYTATYIRQAYGNQLGQQQTNHSDTNVQSGVMRINALLDEGRIREALGIANDLLDKIKRGAAMADDADANLLGRVASFYG